MKLNRRLSTILACTIAASAMSFGTIQADELTHLDVVLDWYPNAIHTFLFEAIENGYFEEEGLEVNLINPADSVDAVNFVASGRAQIGLTYPIDVVQAYASGMPVTSIGAIAQEALECMCSLSSNSITDDMTSLKGKKVGITGTQISKAVINTIAANAGLAEDDFEIVTVGFDLVTALTTGSADLIIGPFINDEVVTMKNAGYELNVYSEQDYGVPELYGLIMAVNSEDYAENSEVYEAFLRACRKGFEDMKVDEDAAVEFIMNNMNTDDNPLDEVQQRESYEILLPKMEPEGSTFLSMSENVWQSVIDWMVETEQIEEGFEASAVMAEINA